MLEGINGIQISPQVLSDDIYLSSAPPSAYNQQCVATQREGWGVNGQYAAFISSAIFFPSGPFSKYQDGLLTYLFNINNTNVEKHFLFSGDAFFPNPFGNLSDFFPAFDKIWRHVLTGKIYDEIDLSFLKRLIEATKLYIERMYYIGDQGDGISPPYTLRIDMNDPNDGRDPGKFGYQFKEEFTAKFSDIIKYWTNTMDEEEIEFFETTWHHPDDLGVGLHSQNSTRNEFADYKKNLIQLTNINFTRDDVTKLIGKLGKVSFTLEAVISFSLNIPGSSNSETGENPYPISYISINPGGTPFRDPKSNKLINKKLDKEEILNILKHAKSCQQTFTDMYNTHIPIIFNQIDKDPLLLILPETIEFVT